MCSRARGIEGFKLLLLTSLGWPLTVELMSSRTAFMVQHNLTGLRSHIGIRSCIDEKPSHWLSFSLFLLSALFLLQDCSHFILVGTSHCCSLPRHQLTHISPRSTTELFSMLAWSWMRSSLVSIVPSSLRTKIKCHAHFVGILFCAKRSVSSYSIEDL